jgi:hypothetical protein
MVPAFIKSREKWLAVCSILVDLLGLTEKVNYIWEFHGIPDKNNQEKVRVEEGLFLAVFFTSIKRDGPMVPQPKSSFSLHLSS